MEWDAPVELTRAKLYKKVWSKSMVQLAEEFGMSDVALKKRCKKHAIPVPPRGYWRKKETGRNPPQAKLPPCPKGVSDTIRFSEYIPGSSSERPVPDEPPLPRLAELPAEEASLHPIAAKLKAILDATEADERGVKRLETKDLPRVSVSEGTVFKCCQCIHALVAILNQYGITPRESDGYRPALAFGKGGEHIVVEISEMLEKRIKPEEPTSGRYPRYAPPEYTYHPTGFLLFQLHGRRGYSGQKTWSESKKQPVERIVLAIAKRILRVFPKMIADGIEAERRHQEYLREQQREDHPKLIRQHQKTILKNLGRATYWWNRSQEIHAFLSALEHQWGADQSEGLTEQQKEWLNWARQEADALSPLAENYPDPKTDGPVDYEAIPIGGPYPKTTDLPKIPVPAPPASESRHPESLRHEYQYPFWLKYQR